jgi:hypothetical protein
VWGNSIIGARALRTAAALRFDFAQSPHPPNANACSINRSLQNTIKLPLILSAGSMRSNNPRAPHFSFSLSGMGVFKWDVIRRPLCLVMWGILDQGKFVHTVAFP